MEDRLRKLLVESRGSSNRIRILSVLNERPQNAHMLAENLNLDYRTVQHHLDVLVDSRILHCSDHDYGAIYLLSE
jgi:DNA-binding transcriptional ArsR family regulator